MLRMTDEAVLQATEDHKMQKSYPLQKAKHSEVACNPE